MNPFPGLRPFEADEADLFFGREGQSDELVGRLHRQRFIAVVGVSGSGKSSLVRAGLLPALYGGFMPGAGSGWRIAVLRPGQDPIGNLARALHAPGVLHEGAPANPLGVSTTEAVLRRGPLGLIDAVSEARLPAGQNVLVVVDQFEELFRLQGEGRHDFVQLLLEAARQRGVPIYVLLTMRSEYLGECAQFRDLPEAINEGQYLIPRMSREERRLAITGPVRVRGEDIAPRLVQRLLNDAGLDPDQLPILQHALMRTWDYWTAHREPAEPVDLRHYESDTVGGWANALSYNADQAYAELDAHGQRLAEKVFRRLAEPGPDGRGVRRPTRIETLCKVTAASEQDVRHVIEVFGAPGRSFLTDTAGLIDISHESLIHGWRKLQQWTEAEAESARMYRRLVDAAARHAAGKAALWRDPDLAQAEIWWKQDEPTEAWADGYGGGFAAAREFLDSSRRARDEAVAALNRERSRKLRRAQGYTAVLLVALVLSALQWRTARRERQGALASRDSVVMVLAALDSTRVVAESAVARQLRSDSARLAMEGSVRHALAVRPTTSPGGTSTWVSQVRQYLEPATRSLSARGYETTHQPFVGRLDQGRSDTLRVTLRAGMSYTLVGVCDNDCDNLDLALYAPDRALVDSDTASDDVPIVAVSPAATGQHHLAVTMASCKAAPCYFAVGVYGKRDSTAHSP